MNSTLGSVVPLAMFFFIVTTCTKPKCKCAERHQEDSQTNNIHHPLPIHYTEENSGINQVWYNHVKTWLYLFSLMLYSWVISSSPPNTSYLCSPRLLGKFLTQEKLLWTQLLSDVTWHDKRTFLVKNRPLFTLDSKHVKVTEDLKHLCFFCRN